MRGFKPLLAHNGEWHWVDVDWRSHQWLASPKFDGYRAVTLPAGGRSRNLKPFPNLDVADFLKRLPPCLDGELVVGEPTAEGCFHRTSELVTRKGRAGLDGVRFFVFDYFAAFPLPFHQRLAQMKKLRLARLMGVEVVGHARVRDCLEAQTYKDANVALGYEGAMYRRADAPYKFGRSTFAEGILLKSKVTLSGEARIVGVEARRKNNNPLGKDELGRAKRSKRKEGMVAVGEVGKFLVEDLKTKQRFGCSPGVLTQEQRRKLYGMKLVGLVVAYDYDPPTKPGGLPRFPRVKGFRSRIDF